MLQLSPAAIGEIQRMKARSQQANAYLRLSVTAGGCLDKIYLMSLEQNSSQPTDQIITAGEIQVLVNAESLEYVESLTIDFSEDLMGSGFRFDNRKISRTCGCGNSFTTTPANE
jgi:iron-sulfur cluster assembly accessory protein